MRIENTYNTINPNHFKRYYDSYHYDDDIDIEEVPVDRTDMLIRGIEQDLILHPAVETGDTIAEARFGEPLEEDKADIRALEHTRIDYLSHLAELKKLQEAQGETLAPQSSPSIVPEKAPMGSIIDIKA